MNIRDQIKVQKYRQLADIMEYPTNAQNRYDWYMRSVPSGVIIDKSGNTTTRFRAVYIQILCRGFEASHVDLGYIEFLDSNFVEKWTQLLTRSKAMIDALNIDPARPEVMASLSKGVCANCDRPAPEDDFLCEICRAA